MSPSEPLVDWHHRLLEILHTKGLVSGDDLLRTIMDTAIDAAVADRGFLFLQRAGTLQAVVARDRARADIPGADEAVSRRVLASVQRARQARIHQAGDGLDPSPSSMALGVKSYVAEPLFLADDLVGVGYLDRLSKEPAYFTDRQRDVTTTFLGHLTWVVELQQRAETQLAEVAARRHFPEIVGRDDKLADLLDRLPRVAAEAAPVLVLGESGTGKELLALAIHRASPRAQGRFVALNCANLSAGLIDSELFGHVRGAYTGAHENRAGLFEEAHGGTLLLDEIGDLPLEAQARLLRVLETGELRRIGESSSRRVDVRVVAATSLDLKSLTAAGRFRSELYFRLAAFVLRLPPLRERRDDIPLLARHFLEMHQRRRGQPLVGFREDALEALREAPWPGNVRELENAVFRACVFAGGSHIERSDLSLEEHSLSTVPDEEAGEPVLALRDGRGFRPWIEIEREYLRALLVHCSGNLSQAARQASVPRQTLVDRLARLGLRGNATDEPTR